MGVITRGEPEGFVEFASAEGRPLFRTAWLLTADWQLSEDLVQETLGRMYVAWPKIDRIDNPAAYAQTVIVRVFLSQRRRRMSRERPAAELPDTSSRDSDHDLEMMLVTALAKLPKRDRVVLVLRYLEDRSVEQVAADLHRSAGAIRTQCSRALARLRAELSTDALDLLQP